MTAIVTDPGVGATTGDRPCPLGSTKLMREARVTMYPVTPAVTEEEDIHEEGGREVLPGADLKRY